MLVLRLVMHVVDCFFFNDPATTEIYTLSLHDALPISAGARTRARACARRHPRRGRRRGPHQRRSDPRPAAADGGEFPPRSEEHTSELQSRLHLVCRLLLEKKNRK